MTGPSYWLEIKSRFQKDYKSVMVQATSLEALEALTKGL
jgi:hypothetical protein